MKNIISAAALVLSLATTAQTQAATGSYDGSYDVEAKTMTVGIKCGAVDYYGDYAYHYNYQTITLENGKLPEDTLDEMIDWRLTQVEAAHLTPAQEAAARTATLAYFNRLELGLNEMLDTYPQSMDVSLNAALQNPLPMSYMFTGNMLSQDGEQQYHAVGSIQSLTGDFAMLPVYYYGWTHGPNYWLYHRLSAGMQFGGSLSQGWGAIRWNAQRLATDYYVSAVWGCSISNVTGMAISPAGQEIPETITLRSKADPKVSAELKSTVARDSVKTLLKEEKLSAQQRKAAELLSQKLMQ